MSSTSVGKVYEPDSGTLDTDRAGIGKRDRLRLAVARESRPYTRNSTFTPDVGVAQVLASLERREVAESFQLLVNQLQAVSA